MRTRHCTFLGMFLVLAVGAGPLASAQEKAAGGETFTFGDGKLSAVAPAGWAKRPPANNVVEAEFSIPPAEGDQNAGRLTVTAAFGGSVQANIDRWVGQFGGKAEPKLDKLSVSDCQVQIVDLSGTYNDAPAGPFAKGKVTMRENYRMLGAIIQPKDGGMYFLKFYGPKATIDKNQEGFYAMVKSLKVLR